MPRYEKSGRDLEYFFEIVQGEPNVYTAQGSRRKGEKKWSMKDSDLRTWIFKDRPAAAGPFFKKKVAEIEAQKYVLVGEATPEVEAMRAKAAAEREKAKLATERRAARRAARLK